MAVAARSVTGKMLACHAPNMAFVTSGFERSVANTNYIPTGLLLQAQLIMQHAGLTWSNL